MVKTYEVQTTPVTGPNGEQLFTVKVQILNELGDVVMEGETSVVTDDQQEAYTYGETVFLTDLKRNMPRRLGDLALPTDAQPAPDEPTITETVPAPEV